MSLQEELAKSRLTGAVQGILKKNIKQSFEPGDINDILHSTNATEAGTVNVVDKLLIICSTAKKIGACERCRRKPLCKEHNEG